MADFSCKVLLNFHNQSPRCNMSENHLLSSSLRMPRTHELRLINQTETHDHLSDHRGKEKGVLLCSHCKRGMTSVDFKMQKDTRFGHTCHLCTTDLMAEHTVKTVLEKVCFESRNNKNLSAGTSNIDSPLKRVNQSTFNSIIKGEGSKQELESKCTMNKSQNTDWSKMEDKNESEKKSERDNVKKWSYGKQHSDLSSTISNTKLSGALIPNNTHPILAKSKSEYDNQDSFSSHNSENHSKIKMYNGIKLCQLYTDEKKIGSGKFGKVCKITHKETNKVYAAKTIVYRNEEAKQNILNEVHILECLHGNDHILQLVEVIDNNVSVPRVINIITEYLDGGELYDQIAKDDLLTEEQVIDIMCQVLDGVNFIHSCGIIHRDIKPENLVYTSKNSSHIKIIDFGFATKFNDKSPPKSMVGTTVFVAPEVLRYEPQSYLTDMWSVGVVAYNLLTGITPFEIPLTGDLDRQLTDKEIIENIERCQYDFNDEGFIDVSEDAKDFISKLLVRDPRKRLTAKESLQHPWFLSSYKSISKAVPRSISVQRMKNYVAIQKWHKLGMAIQTINNFKSSITPKS